MRASRVCNVPGCPAIVTSGRCLDHERAAAALRRQDPNVFSYKTQTWQRRREAVLKRDPMCVECLTAPSTVADHFPRSRRGLLADGERDPDALRFLRGLCARCHNMHTGHSSPGGWADR